MRPHFGALVCTWLVSSLTAGLVSTVTGNVENLVGDGSAAGILDATVGWLVYTFPVSAFIIGIFFLPLAIVLELRAVSFAGAYIAAGLFAVTLFITLIFGVSALPHGLALLALPGVLGGATWWFLAIRKSVAASLEIGIDHA